MEKGSLFWSAHTFAETLSILRAERLYLYGFGLSAGVIPGSSPWHGVSEKRFYPVAGTGDDVRLVVGLANKTQEIDRTS